MPTPLTPRRHTVALLLALVMTATGCGDDDATGSTASEGGDEVIAGEATFQGNCAVCHGSDLGGGAGPALGAGSPAASASDDEVRAQIREGGNGMPPFEETLGEADIDGIVAYLRSVQSGG
jgi:cytochrome c551